MSLNMTADSIPYNNYDDYSKGREALAYFHNSMTRLYPDKYAITFQELLTGLTKRNGQKFFIEGIGGAIIVTDMSLKQVSEAMNNLAISSGGKIPATNGAFYNSLNGIATIGSWVDMVSFVSVETAKDVITGVTTAGEKVIQLSEGVADSAIGIAKSLSWVVPIILVGGVLIYVQNTTKK